MEEKRKPRRWLMWLLVGLMLLVAYPLTIAPVSRLIWDGYLPAACMWAYSPLYYFAELLPEPMQAMLFWYKDICMPPNTHIF